MLVTLLHIRLFSSCTLPPVLQACHGGVVLECTPMFGTVRFLCAKTATYRYSPKHQSTILTRLSMSTTTGNYIGGGYIDTCALVRFEDSAIIPVICRKKHLSYGGILRADGVAHFVSSRLLQYFDFIYSTATEASSITNVLHWSGQTQTD